MQTFKLLVLSILTCSICSCKQEADGFDTSKLSLIKAFDENGKWQESYYYDSIFDRLTYYEGRLSHSIVENQVIKTRFAYSGNKITSINNFTPGNPIMSSYDAFDHEVADTFYYSSSNFPDSSISVKTYANPLNFKTVTKKRYSKLSDTLIVEFIDSEYYNLSISPASKSSASSFKNELFLTKAKAVSSETYPSANFNVSKEKKWMLNKETNVYFLNSECSYTYDNHPNPFSFDPVRRSKNNIVTEDYIYYSSMSTIGTTTSSYRYDITCYESGFPKKIVKFNADLASYTRIFEYGLKNE